MEKIESFWSPVKGVKIQEAEPGLYTFQFFHHLDLQRIIKKGPWYFDNHLLVLNVLPENGAPNQANLQFVPFWIQVHDVPVGLMSEKVGKDIANFLGDFIEYDAKNNSNHLRTYMRIRVMLDVTKPLKRQKKIKKPGGESSYIRFKYERLGNFCYFCGMLGHIEDYCEKLYSIDSDDGTRFWTPDLRVEKQNSSHRQQASGIAIHSPMTVTVSSSQAQAINAESAVTKPVNLASLLRNPQLMRPPTINSQAVTNFKGKITDELLQEENSEASISIKAKRSRGINKIEQPMNFESQLPPILSATTNEKILADSPTPQGNRAPTGNGDKNSVTPMEVSQSSPSFLLAEPGSQACQAK